MNAQRVFAFVSHRLPKRFHAAIFALYPPFLGAGIRVKNVSPDMRSLDVHLLELPWTRNIHGTQFGGSIYAMTDAFYAYMLQVSLGNAYVAWDKAAHIRFRRPGHGTLKAEFRLQNDDIARVRRDVDAHGKTDATFVVHVRDARGNVVAEIEKHVTVKLRAGAPPAHPAK